MKLEAIPITHVDIHGKTIHYIKVTNGVSVHFVHVVERVYKAVKELELAEIDDQPKLPFDETENNEGTQSNVQTGDTEEKGTEPERLEGIRPLRGPRNGRGDK